MPKHRETAETIKVRVGTKYVAFVGRCGDAHTLLMTEWTKLRDKVDEMIADKKRREDTVEVECTGNTLGYMDTSLNNTFAAMLGTRHYLPRSLEPLIVKSTVALLLKDEVDSELDAIRGGELPVHLL